MARERQRRRWVGLMVACLIVAPATLYGFFGTELTALIPLMHSQISYLRQGLQTANQTLGAIKGVKEGLQHLRNYGLSDFMQDYVWSDSDVYGLRSDYRKLRKGGSSGYEGMAWLRKGIGEIESEDSDYQAIDQGHVRFRQPMADDAVMDYGDRLVSRNDEVVQKYEEVSKFMLEDAAQAQSLPDSARVTAHGQAVLVRQNSDSLRLQGQQVAVAQAQLQHQTEEQRAVLVGHLVETAKIAHAFLDLKPMR